MVRIADVLDKPLRCERVSQALDSLPGDRPGARDLRDGARALFGQGPQDAESPGRLT